MDNRLRRNLAQYLRAQILPERAIRRWSNGIKRMPGSVDVSVLISNFNYAIYVREAVESVVSSALGGLRIELIVVDDQSRDDSMDVLRSIMSSAPFPMTLMQPLWNVGVSHARNLSIMQASGRCVFILDADNTIVDTTLRNLWDVIEEEGADAAYGPIEKMNPDGSLVGWISNRPFDAAALLQYGNYIDAMAMFRRDRLLQVGGYDVDLLRTIGGWEDYALWLKFALNGCKVAFHPKPIGCYRVKNDSMVSQITIEEMEAARRLFRARYGRLLDSDAAV